MDIKRSGSMPSRRMPADSFTGTVWQDPIIEAPAPARIRGAFVRFEPKARTAWHTHPLGQTLHVVSGIGRRPALGRADPRNPRVATPCGSRRTKSTGMAPGPTPPWSTSRCRRRATAVTSPGWNTSRTSNTTGPSGPDICRRIRSHPLHRAHERTAPQHSGMDGLRTVGGAQQARSRTPTAMCGCAARFPAIAARIPPATAISRSRTKAPRSRR